MLNSSPWGHGLGSHLSAPKLISHSCFPIYVWNILQQSSICQIGQDLLCVQTHTHTYIQYKMCVCVCACNATVLACTNRCKSFFTASKVLQIYLYLFNCKSLFKNLLPFIEWQSWKMGKVSTETLANSPASDWRIIWLIICFIAMLTKISYGFRWKKKTKVWHAICPLKW